MIHVLRLGRVVKLQEPNEGEGREKYISAVGQCFPRRLLIIVLVRASRLLRIQQVFN